MTDRVAGSEFCFIMVASLVLQRPAKLLGISSAPLAQDVARRNYGPYGRSEGFKLRCGPCRNARPFRKLRSRSSDMLGRRSWRLRASVSRSFACLLAPGDRLENFYADKSNLEEPKDPPNALHRSL